jgi:hypothetical protein
MARCEGDDRAFVDKEDGHVIHPGLTKREYFAGLALQGMLPTLYQSGMPWEAMPIEAVWFADMLIAELNRKPGEQQLDATPAALVEQPCTGESIPVKVRGIELVGDVTAHKQEANGMRRTCVRIGMREGLGVCLDVVWRPSGGRPDGGEWYCDITDVRCDKWLVWNGRNWCVTIPVRVESNNVEREAQDCTAELNHRIRRIIEDRVDPTHPPHDAWSRDLGCNA